MKAVKVKQKPIDAEECLEYLQSFKEEYNGFIQDNIELGVDLADLENRLRIADFDMTASNLSACRESFRKALEHLEEIAEDHQRLCDESPILRAEDAMYQSTRDFEVKKELEKHLSVLL